MNLGALCRHLLICNLRLIIAFLVMFLSMTYRCWKKALIAICLLLLPIWIKFPFFIVS
ncbi:membrane protein [Candidatus Thiomargarita nelsonii]|uniref:Membrane protein n=1 Tax=Candidatus Thiomargarita nelsonii TaxID=1003181 RepID=A0A176RY57_9GAMM|nr:membrane protein [Candidatus Thiomargarita nelsonii]